MNKPINNVIVNGFDRSGTSAICKTLNMHSSIELIMQPFNSGSIRKTMYQILDNTIATKEDFNFFKGLENNYLDNDYIYSEWHKKYSTVHDFQDEKLHVIKTTINHFTIGWVKENFPSIELWGIWRDPFDILASIIRNNVSGIWYTDALEAISNTVKNNVELNQLFYTLEKETDTFPKQAAYLIAVRSYHFFKQTQTQKIINYEIFKTDPNLSLKNFTKYFNLSKFDFSQSEQNDLNIFGKSYIKNKSYRDLLSKEEIVFAEKAFYPLYELMYELHGDSDWKNDHASIN